MYSVRCKQCKKLFTRKKPPEGNHFCDTCLEKRAQWRNRRYTTQTHYVYVLIDPDTNAVHYVGKTNMLHIRYKDHLRRMRYNDQKRKINRWLASLHDRGVEPIMRVVDRGGREYAPLLEDKWIVYFLQNGANLMNSDQSIKRLRRKYPTLTF